MESKQQETAVIINPSNGLIPQNKTNPESPLIWSRGFQQRTGWFLLCVLASVGQCQMWETEEPSHSINLGLNVLPSGDFYILCCSAALKGNCDQRIKGRTQFH